MQENEELRYIVKGNMRATAVGNSGGPGPNTEYSRALATDIPRPRAEVARSIDRFGYGMGPGVPNPPQMMPYGGHEQGMYMQNNGGHILS